MDENTDRWLETVKTAQAKGLDHTIPRRLASTAAERDLRDKTKRMLSQRSYLVPALPWKEQQKGA